MDYAEFKVLGRMLDKRFAKWEERFNMALEDSTTRIVAAAQKEIQQLKDLAAEQTRTLQNLADAVAGQQAAEEMVAQLQQANSDLQTQATGAITALDSASDALDADDPAAPPVEPPA